MSVLGFVSPSNAHPCGNCGAESGGNVLHLSASAFINTPPHAIHGGNMWSGNDTGDIYACDICLWSALRAAFGHLLKAET